MPNTSITQLGHKVSNFDELKEVAPSVFADSHHPNRSNRYSFVPSKNLLHSFNNLGWQLSHAKQQGKDMYARHIIRLENPNLGYLNLKNDQVKPHIILDNSHNGASTCQIHMGLFRLVCTNGLVVSVPGMFSSIKMKHMGIDDSKLKELLNVTIEHYNIIGSHIGSMSQIELSNDEKEEFAIKAYANREGKRLYDEDGNLLMKKLLAEVNPIELLEPLRDEDKSNDLWTTYNVIQEHLVKGIFNKTNNNGKVIKAKSLTNAVRNLELNKSLWQEAELILTNK